MNERGNGIPFGFVLIIVLALLLLVALLTKTPSPHSDLLEQRRKECLAKGGQFGVIDSGSTVCLEPRL